MDAGVKSHYLNASAGSGKTYALSMRFCRLLMLGVKPEEICALTFTRAATRGIFAAIAERFVQGQVPRQAGELAPEEAFGRLLEALPRLQIFTIDAFAAKLAKLFAHELGLNPDFALFEGVESAEGRMIVREAIRRALSATPEASTAALLQCFDVRHEGDATADSLLERLAAFFRDFRTIYARTPEGWGEVARLGNPPAPCTPRERTEAFESLQTLNDRTGALEAASELSRKRYLRTLEQLHAEVDSILEAKTLNPDLWKVEAILADWAETGVCKGRANLKSGEVALDGEACRAAKRLAQDLVGRDLAQTAAHTAQLFGAVKRLVEAFAVYTAEIGRMDFEQLTEALGRELGEKLSAMDPAKLAASPDKLYVAYRLDAALSHLMIDEFQDTSLAQWRILSGLAHELAQDGQKSFFYVGDPKQSIYGWRGGDATLFGDGTRVPDIPAGAPLVESYRSCPAIVAMVNRAMTFGPGELAQLEAWQRPYAEVWQRGWSAHVAHHTARRGYAAMVALPGNQQIWHTLLADAIAERWKRYAGRRVSMAVLAPTRALYQDGADGSPGLLKVLRQRGVDCALDGKRQVADTPLGRLVVGFLQWLADPRGTLWGEVARHIGLLKAPEEMSPQRLQSRWVRRISEAGWVAWLNDCFGVGAPMHATLSAYDCECLEQVRLCFEASDRATGVDPTEMLEALERYEVPCAAGGGALHLMTIHHSKGLTFDVVFTVLYGSFLNEARVPCEATEQWVLEQPRLKCTYEAVPELKRAQFTRQSEDFRDDLCGLYVAITRAKYEQILYAAGPGMDKPDRRPGLLWMTLAPEVPAPKVERGETEASPVLLYQTGEENWWEALEPQAAPSVPPVGNWEVAPGAPPPEVELPSERARRTTIADFLEAEPSGGDGARQVGIALHTQLAEVEWSDRPPLGLFPEVFRKPEEPCDVWRERPFGVRLSQPGSQRLHYMAGQFDRVHLFPRRQAAVIYDFKTGRDAGEAAEIAPEYRKQLQDYRTALALLTGYPRAQIRCVLLFTRTGRAVEVPDE